MTLRPPDVTLLVSLVSITGIGCGPARTSVPPSPATSCCSRFDYVLEATIFQIDVIRLELHVDDGTAAAVRELRLRGTRSPSVDEAIVERYLHAPAATATMQFLIDMSGGRFLANTEGVLRGLGRDGLLGSSDVQRLVNDARSRFAFLEPAGVARGDRIEYRLSADSVTTSYIRASGTRPLHDVQVGSVHRVALLGSYFAPSSDFRQGLLDLVYATAGTP